MKKLTNNQAVRQAFLANELNTNESSRVNVYIRDYFNQPLKKILEIAKLNEFELVNTLNSYATTIVLRLRDKIIGTIFTVSTSQTYSMTTSKHLVNTDMTFMTRLEFEQYMIITRYNKYNKKNFKTFNKTIQKWYYNMNNDRILREEKEYYEKYIAFKLYGMESEVLNDI